MKKQRLFYLDLIRAVALASILIVHFNATVTGYFTLPHKLFTSTSPLPKERLGRALSSGMGKINLFSWGVASTSSSARII